MPVGPHRLAAASHRSGRFFLPPRAGSDVVTARGGEAGKAPIEIGLRWREERGGKQRNG